jgi:hypothetical protein
VQPAPSAVEAQTMIEDAVVRDAVEVVSDALDARRADGDGEGEVGTAP